MTEETHAPHRILFIGHTASLGGAELALLRLVQNLARDRFEPVVMLFADGAVATTLRERGVEVHCVPLSSDVNQASRNAVRWRAIFQGRQWLVVLKHILAVARRIRDLRIDLVHTNTLKAAIIGGVAAAIARKPLVWYVHDRIAKDYLPAIAVRGLHLLARTLPTFVVGNSYSTLRTFLPKLPRRWAVVYPGVDVSLFSMPNNARGTPTNTPRRGVLVGMVGRISPTKGQDIFIRAACLVAKAHPEATFRIIGSAMFNDGPWESEIHRLASECGDTRIEFTGFCADVPEAMMQLDIVVHASTLPEPFGQVVAEAMCCGKPVVATQCGGVPEIVTHGESGWLVPPRDAEQTADRIIWLIDHPQEAAAMGERGRRKVIQNFTVQKMARDMEAIYDQTLTCKLRRSAPLSTKPTQRLGATPLLVESSPRKL